MPVSVPSSCIEFESFSHRPPVCKIFVLRIGALYWVWKSCLRGSKSRCPLGRESMREAGSLVTFHLEHIRQWDPKWLGENFSDNGRLPPLLICRQMIWEMYELNFRSELILLDHFVFDWAGQQQKDEDERLTPASRRSLLVSRMEHWDGDLATVDEIFIYYSAGLCSSDREARVCAVRELLTTMSEWVGVGALGDSQDLVPRGQALLSALTTVPLEDILAWEELCWRHYIRTFYRVFGRPPTLPRMMPLHDDTEEDVLI
ncbi:hypothetical protein CYLTODRAFT_292604 [Cylindrobasidium torrendii FP15055 ss-10]|uniref:Uncharacterized protein n=1 Tax=Cylindrobasidium torrendii FP15055 ss-10 TaxID=1314674 RepID=A0A0D7ARK7_9AGAR|nr:hypothetical protein CYLTODRAFT_292604 [Cylindrobasidium torrendii FP15055 ss-10]